MERTSGTMIQTYGVRGLTCWRCMVSVIDEVRALPGVHGVQVDLVPFGESRVSVVPEGAVTRDQVRGSLGRAGFELVAATSLASHDAVSRDEVSPTAAVHAIRSRRAKKVGAP
jgi:copper chaperone CopZ